MVAGPRRVEMRSIPRREPDPGELGIALDGCGVCGSNLPVWEGRPWFGYPLAPGVPGHEAWGRVETVGDGVSAFRRGDRVAVLGDGAFADHTVVSADAVVAIPAALGDAPFPGEALGCGFNVAARAGFAPGQTVTVVGIGFLGAIVTSLAVQAGARVTAVSRRPFALDVAKTMGAHQIVRFGDDPAGTVAAVAGGLDSDGCDVVVEAVGVQAALDLAGELTGVRGRLVIAGFHQDGPRTVDLQLWNWRGIDVINAHERDPAVALAGIQAAAAAVEAGTFDPSPLYTHQFPLERLGDAMDALVERPDGFLKALVRT